MPEPSITDEQVNGLFDKLNNLELSVAQRALLDGILKIAWDATAAGAALESGFDGSFEPDQAALLVSYQSPPTTEVSMVGRAIKGPTDGSPQIIGRMIARGISRGISRDVVDP